jgi:hypothetical protein
MRPGTRAAASALILAELLAFGAGAAEPRRLRLPSARATIRARIEAEQLLRGGRGPERTLPGRVSDGESVNVTITPAGVPRRVTVDQRLRVHGVGDYFVKIPGPVLRATALPGSTAQPGLRSGSLVWQGFSSSGETLGAHVELDPAAERGRLPLAVRVRARVDGEPRRLDAGVEGALRLDVELTNATATTALLTSASAPARPVAAALDAVHGLLSRGRRPVPGRGGLARAIPILSPVTRRSVPVAAPLRVELTVVLDRASKEVRAPRASVTRGPRGTKIVRPTVLSGERTSRTFTIAARVPRGRPRISLRVVPSPPAAGEARPPRGTTWTDAARRGTISARRMVDRLVRVLAEAARLPDVDGYLGNPDRDGPARTTYAYRVVAGPDDTHAAPPPEPPAGTSSPLGIAAALLVVVVTMLGLAAWWALS